MLVLRLAGFIPSRQQPLPGHMKLGQGVIVLRHYLAARSVREPLTESGDLDGAA